MAAVGGILGAIVGFAVGVAIEVTFWNDKGGLADTIPFAFAVAGVLIGSALGRRLAVRREHRGRNAGGV